VQEPRAAEAAPPADEGILNQKRLVGAKRRLAELTSPPTSPDRSAAGTLTLRAHTHIPTRALTRMPDGHTHVGSFFAHAHKQAAQRQRARACPPPRKSLGNRRR